MRILFTATIDIDDHEAAVRLLAMSAASVPFKAAMVQLVQTEIGHTGAMILEADET